MTSQPEGASVWLVRLFVGPVLDPKNVELTGLDRVIRGSGALRRCTETLGFSECSEQYSTEPLIVFGPRLSRKFWCEIRKALEIRARISSGGIGGGLIVHS